MKQERIINSTTKLDHVYISWSEQMLDTDENMRFICRDMYSLLDLHNEKAGTAKKYYREETRIIIINEVLAEEGYENNIDKVMKTFLDHYSNHIIVSQVTPSINTIKTSCNNTAPITGLDGVNEHNYTISADGAVFDRINNEHVPLIWTEKGPMVGLYKNLTGICFYSIPHLMIKAFDIELCDEKIWEDGFKELCNQYEHFGFVSINHYCQFENSCAYIYPNKIGLKLLDQAADLTNKDNKGE